MTTDGRKSWKFTVFSWSGVDSSPDDAHKADADDADTDHDGSLSDSLW
jgi:hypothetical protein